MTKRDAKRAVARQVLALIKENQTKLFEQIVTDVEQDKDVREKCWRPVEDTSGVRSTAGAS